MFLFELYSCQCVFVEKTQSSSLYIPGICIKQVHLRGKQYTIFRQAHSTLSWTYWDVVIILHCYGYGSRVATPDFFWSQARTHFSRMCCEGVLFHVECLGVAACSLEAALPSAKHPQPFAVSALWPYYVLLAIAARGVTFDFWRIEKASGVVLRGRRGFQSVTAVLCCRRSTFQRFSEDYFDFFEAGAVLWRSQYFPKLSEDDCHFSWQTQHFVNVHVFFSRQAQHFRRMVLRVFCDSHWQCWVKWWQCRCRGRRGTLWHFMKIVDIPVCLLKRPRSFWRYVGLYAILRRSSIWSNAMKRTAFQQHSPLQTWPSPLCIPCIPPLNCTCHTPLHTVTTLHTSHFAFCTPHSPLYTTHPTLLTLHAPHSALDTLHSSLPTPIPHTQLFIYTPLHSTYLHIVNPALYTQDSTLHTLHSTLYTLQSTLHTSHSTFHTLHFWHSTLHTLRSALCTPQFTLYTSSSTLHTLHSAKNALPLNTLHSTVWTLHLTLRSPTPDSNVYNGMVTEGNLFLLHKVVFYLMCKKGSWVGSILFGGLEHFPHIFLWWWSRCPVVPVSPRPTTTATLRSSAAATRRARPRRKRGRPMQKPPRWPVRSGRDSTWEWHGKVINMVDRCGFLWKKWRTQVK